MRLAQIRISVYKLILISLIKTSNNEQYTFSSEKKNYTISMFIK